MKPLPVRGRGAQGNPANRFEGLELEREAWTAEDPGPETRLLRDRSRSIISRNRSPDVGFEASVNPYRGCEHGCVYCYARPTHEYLGFSAGLDFESRILVKEDAPALLRRELASPDWKPTVLVMSGVTDPYQPAERRLGITRACLEVLADARNPVAVITKSRLVTRDADHLATLAAHGAARVSVSVTTLDESLRRILEPRAPTPGRRLDAIQELSAAGVPVGVMVAPVIPGLTEHEIPAILESAAAEGATHAAWIMLRLPHGVSEMFGAWLETHFPDRKDKVLGRIRDVRGGRLNDPRFGSRMRGGVPLADHVARLFRVSARRFGLDGPREPLSAA
ncbi:MAG TPA: PA0069 family radical SAM protein, partial [Gemmatimonadota bacterium]|nr:PA0069 family radical SAM protein [Gemmatimonadota bacterium]